MTSPSLKKPKQIQTNEKERENKITLSRRQKNKEEASRRGLLGVLWQWEQFSSLGLFFLSEPHLELLTLLSALQLSKVDHIQGDSTIE